MKKTLATTIRCDARQAAELVLFFNSRGIKIENVSDLLRNTIDTLISIAKKNQLARSVETTEEAIEILRAEGVINLTIERKNRNFQTLIKELESEDIILDDEVKEFGGNSEFKPTPEMLKAYQKRLDDDRKEFDELKGTIPNIVED